MVGLGLSAIVINVWIHHTMHWVLSIFLRGLTLGGNWDLRNVVRFVVGCQSHCCTSVAVLGIFLRVVIKKLFFLR